MKKILKEQLLYIFKITGFITLLFCLFNLTIYTEINEVGIFNISINISQAYAFEIVEDSIKAIIHLFVSAVVWFLTFGLSASAAIVDPALFDGIFSGMDTSLYDIWTFIRDIFNVFFIFILLFSAFATIFQIQKYHIFKSNILIMIIIMSLLVNFSWPITRVIIDAGNITMYYLLDGFIDSDGPKADDLFGMFGDKSDIIKQLAPDMGTTDYENQSITDGLFSLLMVFAFACAFIVVAILFLIRISAFVLLLIFSPIGFAAAVFPGTKKFSDMWWDALLKWTFVGPILLFMIFISIKFLTVMKDVLTKSNVHGFTSFEFVQDALMYSTALVMIFAGIAASQQMGGSAAQMAIGQAKSLGKRIGRGGAKWGGAAIAGGVAIGARGLDSKTGNHMAKTSGYIRGFKKRLFDNETQGQEQWRRAKEDANAESRELHGESNATKNHIKKAVAEDRERTKHQNTEDLHNIINDTSTTKHYKQAAREEIASRENSIKTSEDLTKNLTLMGDSLEDNIKLLENAAKDDVFANGSADDYKNLIDAINSKTTMSNADKNILKSKVKERYLEEESAKSVYDYHKTHVSSSSKAALEETFKDSTLKDISKQEGLIKESSSDVAVKNFYKELAINQHNKGELIANASTESRKILKSEHIV